MTSHASALYDHRPAQPVFNVPFLPDGPYIDFLNHNRKRLSACHYSLFSAQVADGRYKSLLVDAKTLTQKLKTVAIEKKYVLLNARFNAPDRYRDSTYLLGLAAKLDALAQAGVLHGVVFADAYLLRALSDTAPAVVCNLEAVPSINMMIDRTDKALSLLGLVAQTGFRFPARLPLDRSLNRDPRKVAHIAAAVKKRYPQIKMELLANEGCLFECPFKLTHDSLIALLGMGVAVDTLAVNRDCGCMRQLGQDPWQILASPFLRPEEIGRVAGAADIIKICGRTLGPAFLTRTVQAYLGGSYRGNLFDLLDASHWMADRYNLPNHLLPENLYETMGACPHACHDCDCCRTIWERLAEEKPFSLADKRTR